jgi:branched-subunit amino acid transport protein AzlD
VDAERICYLVAAVAVGWAVTYSLRALPFALFSRSSTRLPPWVDRLGDIISPVIIAALVVYSYSGLEWKTFSPYLAGFATVAMQLKFRNPLLSIISGTALYMVLLYCL